MPRLLADAVRLVVGDTALPHIRLIDQRIAALGIAILAIFQYHIRY